MGKPLSKELLVFLVITILAVGYVVMDVNSTQTSNDVAGQGYKARCLKYLKVHDDNWLSVGQVLTIKTPWSTYTIELLEVNQVYTENNPNKVNAGMITINGEEPFWVMEGETLDYSQAVIMFNDIKTVNSETKDTGVVNIRYVVPLTDQLKRSCVPKLKHGNQWIVKNEQITLKPYGNQYAVQFLDTKNIQTQSGKFKSAQLNVNGDIAWWTTETDGVYDDLFMMVKDVQEGTMDKTGEKVIATWLDYVYVE